ncbi:MAG: hypothetical protein K0S47_564 [Herbinix sp.]|jgi:hypothetical protein|nr:hypothetical protein [Herbinix sp.]
MRKTRFNNEEDGILINTIQLQRRLNAGYKTANIISEEAKARVYVGRRVWHNVSKIEKYLEKISM